MPTKNKVALEVLRLINEREDAELVGSTSLAEGADQVFAFAVLAAGGEIDVVVPAAGYEKAFPTEASAFTFQALRSVARNVTTLPFNSASEEAFLAAGHKVVDEADELIAIWDGKKAAGKGGTGDIVEYAEAQGKRTHIIWPSGSERSPH